MSDRTPKYLLEDILSSAENWFRIRGFRNRIVHNYFGIDHEIVWKIKEDHISPLISEIKKFLNKLN